MFKLNWIIVLIIIILLVLLYANNSEKFSGTLNTEAVTNISSVYNTNNLTATNITATNNLTANNGSLVTGDHDKLRIYTKKDANDKGFLWFNKDGNMGFAPDGANTIWTIKSDPIQSCNMIACSDTGKKKAVLCLGNACINEDHLKILTGDSFVEVVGHNGILDNVYNRCGKGDSDRDIGVNCSGTGHSSGWNKWKLRIK